MQPHKGDVQHIRRAQTVPRIQHAILSPTYGDAHGLHFLDTRQTAPLGECVMASLQHDVDQRIRNSADPSLGDQRQQF